MQNSIDVQDLAHDSADPEEDPARDQLEAHLRESIVGRYIRNYNRRLRTLNQELENIQQQVDDKLTGIDRHVSEEIAAVKTDIRSLSDQLGGEDLGLTLEKN